MENKKLRKLENEEKGAYLNNLDFAVQMAKSHLVCNPLYDNFKELINILQESRSVELDISSGLPSTVSILGIITAKKDIGKEFEELKVKLASGQEEEQDLEQMLVGRIKSKIYSFDTFIAEEMESEGTPFHEALNTEFVLKDRLYFLKAVESSSFNLDNRILLEAGDGLLSQTMSRYFDMMGFDSSQGKFMDYRVKINFLQKSVKKIFTNSLISEFKPRVEKLLKDNFLTKDIGSMYKIVSGINKNLSVIEASRIVMGPYADMYTGKTVPVPDNFFKNYPEAFVLDVSVENLVILEDSDESSKKDDMIKEKTKTVYKFCSEGIPRSRLADFYKGSRDIQVFGTAGNRESDLVRIVGHGGGGIHG